MVRLDRCRKSVAPGFASRSGLPKALAAILALLTAASALAASDEPGVPLAGQAFAQEAVLLQQPLPAPTVHANGADAPRVLILSGDGGWGDVERHLAEDFLRKGMAVTGVDSRKAFNRKRDLDEVVAFVEGLVTRDPRLIIVGYSFGADLLPVIWPHLSKALRHKTVRVAMIAPTHEGSLGIDPTGRYDGQAMPVIPLKETITHAPHHRLICIYGAEEKLSGYSSCLNPGFDPARRIELPGGHNLNRSYSQIAAAIAEEMEDKREAAAP